MTVEAIKEAISELPVEDRTSLALWLNELEYDDWDKEMVRDFAPGGKAYHLVEKINREVEAGKARPMDEALAERSKSHP